MIVAEKEIVGWGHFHVEDCECCAEFPKMQIENRHLNLKNICLWAQTLEVTVYNCEGGF